MNSAKKVTARDGLGAEAGEELGTGCRVAPELVEWEKGRGSDCLVQLQGGATHPISWVF